MIFKPAIWYPIAVGLTLINLAGVGFTSTPWHAASHAALALGFGLWAQRLRRLRRSQADAPEKIGEPLQAHLEALETEMNQLRRELNETQERLDFAERLLVQERETRRMGPQR